METERSALKGIEKAFICMALSQALGILGYAEPPKIAIQSGHLSSVSAAAFSPDGKFVLTGGLDDVVRVWNLNGRMIRVIGGYQGCILGIFVFGDDNRIITASSDGKVKLLTFTGEFQKVLYSVGNWEIKSIQLAPDKRSVYIVKYDTVSRVDLDGKLLWEIKPGQKSINISLNWDGAFFVSAGEGPQITIWSSEGLMKGGFDTPYSDPKMRGVPSYGDKALREVKVDRDNNILINNGDLSLWSLSGRRLKTLATNQPNGLDLLDSFQPLSGGLACNFGSGDPKEGTLRLYSNEGRVLKDFDINESVNVFVASPDERSFALGGQLGSVSLVTTEGDVLFHNASVNQNKDIIQGISSLALTKDGLHIIAGTENGNIQIWSTTGRLEKDFEASPINEGINVAVDPSGKIIYTADSREHIGSWDMNGDQKSSYFDQNVRTSKSYSGGLAISPDGRIIATELNSGLALLTQNLRISGRIDFKDTIGLQVKFLSFSSDGRNILASTPDGLWLFPVKGGAPRHFHKKLNGYLNCAVPAPGQEEIVGVYGSNMDFVDGKAENMVIVWSWDGKEKHMIKEQKGNVTCAAFDPNGKFFVTGGDDKSVRVWDPDGRPLRVFQGHTDRVNCLAISADGRKVFSGGKDGIINVWDMGRGDNVSLLSVAGEWIAYSSEGYFDSSKDAGRILGMTVGNQSFSIDQFAIRNNRPDIILGLLGSGTHDLIDYYFAQYQKRLRRLGVNEKSLAFGTHLPETDIIRTSVEANRARVSLRFSDTQYNLLRYNVYINGVPLYGADGRPIEGRSSELEDTFLLSSGKNKVEVSCLNEKGVESYRALVFLSGESSGKGSLYFLGFGVSLYKNPALNLKYAAKDAHDLAEAFRRMASQYREVFVKILTDEQVTVDGIRSTKDFLNSAGPDDTFVLFIAGHGVHDTDKEGTYYFLTYDADPDHLSQTSANFDVIEDILQGVPPRNKLFLMDTCESGELDPGLENTFFAMARSRGISARAIQGRGIRISQVQAKPRPYLFERDRYIYNDLLRRSGAIVFSSSRGGEFSYESDNLKNGFFTCKLKEAVATDAADKDGDGMVSVDELRDYVSREVPKLSADKQHPTVDRDNVLAKFSFPRVKN